MKHQYTNQFATHDKVKVPGTPTMAAGLLVASEDLLMARDLALPVALIEARGSQDEVSFRDAAGEEIALDQVMLQAIGCLPLSRAGEDALLEAAVSFEGATGSAAPEILPVEADDPAACRMAVLEWLVARLADERQVSAARSARQMREIAILRRQHEESQAAFRDLETFLWQSGAKGRKLDVTLSPLAGQMPTILQDGAQLIQRLPGTSPGLSDIAIHVANETLPTDGVLHASLSSPETGETLAIWEIPAEGLRQGWLRLGLERALGSDPVTLVLTLSYQGRGSVRLSTSLHHPEERFRGRLDGQSVPHVPALQIWRWIAGASAPLVATAIKPVGSTNRLRRVPAETLITAKDMNDPGLVMKLQPGSEGLLVHVLEDRDAGAILSGLALSGLRHVRADIRTCHAEAPLVEYRVALAPRAAQPGEPVAFQPQHVSGWVRLAPLEDGQVHLILPEPLDEPCDIHLITRLPMGVHRNSYGWSTFANLTLQY